MQQHTLRITAQDQPTVLERLLQVTRYRGFIVTGMTMFPSVDESVLDIELTVQSDKSIDHLHHQLNKLIDVSEISVNESDALKCRA
ncbi:MAG: acetolactate synthase 2 small subunit [Alteromonadaceae bacterium]|nr:acetolactate synthase 2 small subunit [Alteromonadaceae bacterium]